MTTYFHFCNLFNLWQHTDLDSLLSQQVERLQRRLHLFLRQANQHAIVLHADLIDSLSTTFLQSPFHLRRQVLEAVLRGIHQLQLERQKSRQIIQINMEIKAR